MIVGWFGGGEKMSGWEGEGPVVGTGVDVRDEERDFILFSALEAPGGGRPNMGFVAARFSGSPFAETSNSGKVMKKRQPNVVPKKAPSTD